VTLPARRDIRRDLAAAVTILIGLTFAVWSCAWGGPPMIFMWGAWIMFACAAKLGLHEPTPPARDPGLADPEDPNAMHVESVRGPDTT